jgi:lysophospholipase L1-like esterase
MPSIDLDTVAGLLDGHVDVRRRQDSIQPLRVPVAELGFYDPFTRWVASTPAGVRLRFRSDTRSIGLDTLQRAAFGDRQVTYDLVIDGARFAQARPEGGAVLNDGGGFTGDERASVSFEALPAGGKAMELWLPQSATVAIKDFRIDDGATLETFPDQRPTIVFHGSSITHAMEADGGRGAWPAVAAALAGMRLVNLGWAGSCLLSGLAARIVRDQRADVIVLKLGINVHGEGLLKERTFADSAHSMISIIRDKHPTTPMVIVSPVWSPPRETQGAAGAGLSLERMREILEAVVAARAAAGDRHIRYLSGLELFGPEDRADLPDELHPNAIGQQRMGERFYDKVIAGRNNSGHQQRV